MKLGWRQILIAAGVVLALAAPVLAQEEPANEARLRKWFVNLQLTSGSRDRYDVFQDPSLPQSEVQDSGDGGGLVFGYRFGERFLLGLQMTVVRHELVGLEEHMYDVEGLLTGTVLFNQRGTLQPFLRGGFGGTGLALEQSGAGGQTTVFGTAAVAGGGIQIRVSSRISFELEVVATFANYLEVQDRRDGVPQVDWQVRESNIGSRSGLGLSIWF